nr:hypothetical protein GCM10025732_16900 [Glycomyces mayteni]
MTTRNVDARRLNVKGLLIAVGLPVVLVGALVATLLGTGAFSRENEGEDASLWLWTTPLGEIARVNGLTAATDVRLDITDAAGNAVQIEQTDSHLLLREIATGKVSAIDLSTLEVTGNAETAPGEGVRVALSDEGAFIIDQTQGLVNQVDPQTLSAIGDPSSSRPGSPAAPSTATGCCGSASPAKAPSSRSSRRTPAPGPLRPRSSPSRARSSRSPSSATASRSSTPPPRR